MYALLILLVSVATFAATALGTAPPPPAPPGPLHADAVAPSQAPTPDTAPAPPLFETANRCMACHNGVALSSGQDVSFGFDWRASMMAHAARDPYWQAAVRREIVDHPAARAAIEDKCATCHMPMARYEAHLSGRPGRVFANLPVGQAGGRAGALAADGVSCSTCHQIRADGLGEPESFTGGFTVDASAPWGERTILGPFQTDRGRATVMRSATGFAPREAAHLRSSELCASCHTLYTHPMDDEGNVVGELPEQVPYLEWRESDFAREGRSCQACHMPVVREPVPVTGVLGEPRDSVNRHVFRGGNFLMLGMLNRYRDELSVEALPQELDAAVRRTVEHLRSESATVRVEQAGVDEAALTVDVTVESRAGHKLPTAYPSRRAWIHLTVLDGEGEAFWESGALEPSGAIRGNDNDEDATRFEPHHRVVTDADQVQIYEAVMVDAEDRVTTGLLRGVRYAKDNRLLPGGFDKGAAHEDVAVQGRAGADHDFLGGSDRVRYRVPVGGRTGPFRVEAELRYQPIGYRWARNLAGYATPETDRFVRYWTSMADVSAVTLARGEAVVR